MTNSLPAVKIIFEMFAEGHGYSSIIDTLNEQGYKTKKGCSFSKNSLYEILANEKYTSTFIFNRASSKDSNGKRNNHNSKSIGNGICGKRMQENLRFSGRYKNRLSTYCCNTHRSDCENKEINKDYIDAYIDSLLKEKIFNSASLHKIVNTVNQYINRYNKEYDSHYNTVKSEYDTITQNLDNITRAIEKGVITESIISRAESLEEQKNEIESKLSNFHRYTNICIARLFHS